MWGSTSRPGSIGCSTTANAPPVSAPETLNTTPMPPSQTERPSPGFTTVVGTSIGVPPAERQGPVLTGERQFRPLAEQLQARAGHFLHRINSRGEDPVGDDLVGLLRQT